MAYLALYRKWRPRTFSEVVGQDPIMTALKNQVKSGGLAMLICFAALEVPAKTSNGEDFARAVQIVCILWNGDPCQ